MTSTMQASAYRGSYDGIDEKTVARVMPCPFCGTKPEVMTSGDGGKGLMIHCIADNCPNPSTSYYDHKSAIRVWNRRVVPIRVTVVRPKSKAGKKSKRVRR